MAATSASAPVSEPAAPTEKATSPTAAPAVPEIAQPVQVDDPDTAPGVRKTPFIHPAKGTEIPAAAELTTEQQTAYNSVLNTVAAWTHVPVSTKPDADQQEITADEQQWLTRECLLRYLRATKWDVTEAVVRLQATLAWRREYGLHGGKLTAEYISEENETGKQWLVGYDGAGRPCHYLNPSRQNTERSDRQIEHLVFMMERDIDIMPAGQETLALLINFAETRKGQGATVGQGRQVLSILQAHYPERLGRALLTNLPWFFWAFMKVITPFIDPLTRQKLIYNDDLAKHVPPAQLLRSHGGDVDFEYDHAAYWPALNALADERRAAARQRWVDGGKRVGEYEAYLKGAQADGVAATIAKHEAAEREKRPVPHRSATSRSGGLRVDRPANGGGEADQQQRPRKSVSIYDGREGHEGAGATTTTTTEQTLPPPILKNPTVESSVGIGSDGSSAAATTTTTEEKKEVELEDTGDRGRAETLPVDDTNGTKEGTSAQEDATSPASPTQVFFTDGEGNPLPADAGTGKRQSSPAGAPRPRRVSNPKPPQGI